MKTIILASLLLLVLFAYGSRPVKWCIDTACAEQRVSHFGASDAWSMQFVGLWPETQQHEIADWLFSIENDSDGRPKGIGLSVWRFNLGAGSAEQGDAAQINAGTRTECVVSADGVFDPAKQLGQRRFLRLAKQRGVPHFLAFLNSMPVRYTKNGLATNTGRDGTINLRDDCYDDAAQFVATALKGIEQYDDIHFDYFCPVNEPDGHWNWIGPKQEGSPATHREVARLVRAMSGAFEKNRVSTAIMVNESSDLRCLLDVHETDWQRGYAIRTFFSPDSVLTYLGKTPGVPHIINAHSYWTNTPLSYMRTIREQLRDTLKRYGLKYWQTETCIMGNDKEIGGGGGYDFSMRTALYVARIIHHDLVYGNAESWSWWRALGGDYKDGLLRVYSDDHWKTGRALPSKLMWTLGNYSRFVRPGAVRYAMTATDIEGHAVPDGETNPRGVMTSAYRNADGSWVVVAINYGEAVQPFAIGGVATSWQAYRTSDREGESLKPVTFAPDAMWLEPRSVTTFVSLP